jgi:DNA-binding CsgD family transcriptional regulator
MNARVTRMRYGRSKYLVLSYPLARPGCFAELTAAELDVAERAMAGASTHDIACDRGVSERTIANQLAQIYFKLRIGSRRELTALVCGVVATKG